MGGEPAMTLVPNILLSGILTVILSPSAWWRKRLSGNGGRLLARLWPWLFIVCLAASVVLVIGSLIAVYFFDVNNANFFSNLFLFSLALLILTVVAAFAHDVQSTSKLQAAIAFDSTHKREKS